MLFSWLASTLLRYRKLELALPLTLEFKVAKVSYFSFLFLFYLCLEFLRGYLIMVVVVDYLAFDYDLLFGLIIWLVAISWPPFIPVKYRTSPWVLLLGVYFYLFPMFIAVFPIVLILLYLIGVSKQWRYLVLSSLFLMIGIYQGENSLFILLYIVLVFFSYFRTVSDLKHPRHL